MLLCVKQLYPAYQDRLTKVNCITIERSSNIHLLVILVCCYIPFYLYIAAEDYGRILTTSYFLPDRSVTVVVQVKFLDDALREEEERFTVELTAFDLSVVLVNSITEVVIEDDDGEGMTQIHNYTLHYEIIIRLSV